MDQTDRYMCKMEAIALPMITATKICEVCEEEATGDCAGDLCVECCEMNRCTGTFQCCERGRKSRAEMLQVGHNVVGEEPDDEKEAGFRVGHGSTRRMCKGAAALLKATEMVERKQRGDGNCMFRALAVAAGMKPEHHKELRRKVTNRMKAGPDKVSMKMLGTWGTNKVLQVAAEVMRVRVRVVQMDGSDGEPVETQTVG